jgi:hypothetical protein
MFHGGREMFKKKINNKRERIKKSKWSKKIKKLERTINKKIRKGVSLILSRNKVNYNHRTRKNKAKRMWKKSRKRRNF